MCGPRILPTEAKRPGADDEAVEVDEVFVGHSLALRGDCTDPNERRLEAAIKLVLAIG